METTANKKQNGKKQTFTLTAPQAGSVQLVGDFTHWKEHPLNMQRSGQGIWHATVEMKPGTHRYRFLVDGQWSDDPDCTIRVPNPYGTQDAVRQVN